MPDQDLNIEDVAGDQTHPMPVFSSPYGEVDVEVVPEETEPSSDKEREKLEESIRETQERLKNLEGPKTDDVSTVVAQAVDRLTEKLSSPQSPPLQPQQRQPQETEEEFKAKLDKKFYEEGFYDTMTEFSQKKLAPLFNQVIQNNLYFGKRFLEQDDKTREFYKKYQAEIDQEVLSMTPDKLYNDPSSYERAYSIVAGRHQEEILQDKLQVLVEQEVQKRMAALGPTKAGPARIPFSESGLTPKPSKEKEKVQITEQERKRATSLGIRPEDYAQWKRDKLQGGN